MQPCPNVLFNRLIDRNLMLFQIDIISFQTTDFAAPQPCGHSDI